MMALTEMLQPTLLAVMFKGTLVLVLAAVACFLLRRSSASGRYLVWASALVVLIALPALAALFPSWYVPVNTAILASHFNIETPVSGPAATGSGTEETGAPMESVEVNGEEAAPVTPVPSVENDPARATNGAHLGAISRMTRANSAALVLWLIGSIAVLARLGFGFIGIWWIARRARPVTDPGLLDLIHELSEQIGLKTPVRLLQSSRPLTPMTWGITWPAILVPPDALAWSEDRRRMVLLHELAHVQRRDCLVQFVVWMACSLYWMNPLVWVAVRKMHIERERACDDLVLASGFPGSAYAEHLLDVAKGLRAAPLSALTTMAMAHRSHFETRLLAILDPGLRRHGWSRVASTAFVAIAATGTVALATMQTGEPTPREPIALGYESTEPESSAQTEPLFLPEEEPERLAEMLSEALPEPLSVGLESALSVPLSVALPEPLAEAIKQARIVLRPEVEVSLRPALERVLRLTQRGGVIVRRNEIADQLTEEERDRLIASLTASLEDESVEVRQAAALALVQLGDTEAARDALLAALSDPSPDVRRDVIYALGEIEDPRSFDSLVTLLSDSASDVRRAAAWALGELDDARAVEPLVRVLGDQSAEVRRAAIQALGELDAPQAVAPLMAQMQDLEADVRRSAAYALGEIGDPAAVATLRSALDDANTEVRRAVAYALGELNTNEAVEPLIAALGDESAEVRRAAISALAEIDDPAAVDPLIGALADSSAEVRRFAAYALGEIRDSRAVEPLMGALGDSNPEVRRFAAYALGEIGSTEALEPLTQALNDPNAEVRRAAANAIREILD